MLLRTKHLELEIANFIFLRAPLLGSLYIGPDAGFGCWMRISPNKIDDYRQKYIASARRILRARAFSKRSR